MQSISSPSFSLNFRQSHSYYIFSTMIEMTSFYEAQPFVILVSSISPSLMARSPSRNCRNFQRSPQVLTMGMNLSDSLASSLRYCLFSISLDGSTFWERLRCAFLASSMGLPCRFLSIFCLFFCRMSSSIFLISFSRSSPISTSPFIQGWLRISEMVSLWVGSKASMELRRSFSSGENLLFFSWALQNLSRQLRAMNLQNPLLGVAETKGALDETRMKRVTPAAKRSFITPLQFLRMSSQGDLKESDPQMVLGLLSLVSLAESPKSAILMLQRASKRMFWGLMSLWMMLEECRQLSAPTIWWKRVRAMVSLKGPNYRISPRLQGAYSNTSPDLFSACPTFSQTPSLMLSCSLMM